MSDYLNVNYLQCPYDHGHYFSRDQLTAHLMECRVRYMDGVVAEGRAVEFRLCRVNPAHHVPAAELEFHEMLCEETLTLSYDTGFLDDVGGQVEEVGVEGEEGGILAEVNNGHVECYEENWVAVEWQMECAGEQEEGEVENSGEEEEDLEVEGAAGNQVNEEGERMHPSGLTERQVDELCEEINIDREYLNRIIDTEEFRNFDPAADSD